MGAAKDYPKLVSVIVRALSHEKISRFALSNHIGSLKLNHRDLSLIHSNIAVSFYFFAL